MIDIRFEAIDNKETISTLETEWRNSITFPHDSGDEAAFDSSQYWTFNLEEKTIGYACISNRNTLYQFYITDKYLHHGKEVLEKFLKQREIKKALIGTNSPICMTLIMHFQKSIEIDSYIFKDTEEINQDERDVEFRVAKPKELEQIINFHIKAFEISEAPQDWIPNYYSDCLSKGVIFVLENKNEIIGILEARTYNLGTKITSLGIVILPKYRNQGYGSYLLIKGKSLAKFRQSEAICGCDAKNISSLKAIEKSGFRILHLILMIDIYPL